VADTELQQQLAPARTLRGEVDKGRSACRPAAGPPRGRPRPEGHEGALSVPGGSERGGVIYSRWYGWPIVSDQAR
jgi:hypothetical protein